MKATPQNPIAILTDPNLKVLQSDADQPDVRLYTNDTKTDSVPRSLPFERRSITYQFNYNDHDAFLIVGLDDNNVPIELLLHLPYADQMTTNLCDLCLNMASSLLQAGVDLEVVINQLKKSPLDLANTISRFLESRFASEVGTTVDSLSRSVVVELENNIK